MHMNIENLENDLISFELSDEDLKVIRGGGDTTISLSSLGTISFPIRISPWIIIIKAPPIQPSGY